MGRAADGAQPPDRLVRAAKAGESWALTAMWRHWSPAVTGYLRGHGVVDADDITSDVFVAVFERLHRFRGDDDDLRRFVFTVAHHRLVDDVRRNRRRGEVAAYDSSVDPRRAASAEDEALTALRADHIDELLAALSPDQREVILLRVIGDLSLEQAARVMGKRVGAVKALQHRALGALRRVLEEAVSL